MASLEKKSFDNPDETKTPDKTLAQTVNFGTVAATKITAQPGWSWSGCIKPHVGGDSCQAGHVGMVSKGTIRVKHDDGTEIVPLAMPTRWPRVTTLGSRETRQLKSMNSTTPVRLTRSGNKPEDHTTVYDSLSLLLTKEDGQAVRPVRRSRQLGPRGLEQKVIDPGLGLGLFFHYCWGNEGQINRIKSGSAADLYLITNIRSGSRPRPYQFPGPHSRESGHRLLHGAPALPRGHEFPYESDCRAHRALLPECHRRFSGTPRSFASVSASCLLASRFPCDATTGC